MVDNVARHAACHCPGADVLCNLADLVVTNKLAWEGVRTNLPVLLPDVDQSASELGLSESLYVSYIIITARHLLNARTIAPIVF